MPTRAERVRERSAERRANQRIRLRDEIVAVAEEQLMAKGYAGFSLREVAEGTGYTATTMYRHFRDKDDLLRAVLERWFARFAESLAAADRGAPDPTSRLLAMAAAYLRFAREHPAIYRAMFLERMDIGVLPDGEGFRDDPAFGVLVRAMEALAREGRTGSMDVLTSAMTLWAAMHGVAAMVTCSDMLDAMDVDALGRTVARTVLLGLRAS